MAVALKRHERANAFNLVVEYEKRTNIFEQNGTPRQMHAQQAVATVA